MISYFFSPNNIIQESALSQTEKALKSVLMRNILGKALDLSKLDTSVILIGEIGTGKKRMAQIIHANSSRAPHPFYSFYCLELSTEEYEDAFRGQLYMNDDHFTLEYNAIEKATKGTLYLEQFSELSSDLMLNIIKSFKKGSEQLFRYSKEARPRLILSVNMESYVNLVNTPNWETILHMLDPHVIMLPPLRERRKDIPLLIDSFLNKLRSRSKKFRTLSISEAALEACSSYHWPGNIRQLYNALLQGALLCEGKTIESHHFPFSMNWNLPYKTEGNPKTIGKGR